MLDAAELRRASATDAGAVAQYLSAIDNDELDALLDAFADAERKKKDDSDALEWRALIHVLLRTRVTRQRSATRILQSLWRGHASEMEALRWVSEISLAYMAAVTGPATGDSDDGIAAELRMMLQITLQFVRDAMAEAKSKALPQFLALVPVLLQLLTELEARTRSKSGFDSTADVANLRENGPSLSAVHEHVVQLLELPWDSRSVPHLLELLRENTGLVSRSGWTQLRQSVEQLISPHVPAELPTDCINPLIRECLLLTAACANVDEEASGWVCVARFLLRRLPVHMRHEAEFNIQMSFHQYPSLASIVCDVLLSSGTPANKTIDTLVLDASDAVLLLHAIRASKPLLHHHLVSSTVAAAADDGMSVFSKAQRLIRRVLVSRPGDGTCAQASHTGKTLHQSVTSILEFGGRQLHARVWKAQLLQELARLWVDPTTNTSVDTSDSSQNADVGILVIESVFTTVPEVREEILHNLLESARVPAQSKRALLQTKRLVANHTHYVVPFRQIFEDWLSSLASIAHHTAQLKAAFEAVVKLVVTLKEFYNFAMVLLRKQLSSPHKADHHLAIDIWCSWLESGLSLDAQQEEEVVLAIKQAVQLVHDRAWMFQRMAQIFKIHVPTSPPPAQHKLLRNASLIEFHRLFSASLHELFQPAGSANDSVNSEYDSDLESDDGTERQHNRRLPRFSMSSLDVNIGHNSTVAAALGLGALLESVLLCLQGVESVMGQVSDTLPGIENRRLAQGFVRWVSVFVRHREEFFQWICGGDGQFRVGDSRFVWTLAARVSLGCALCNLALRRCLQPLPPSAGGVHPGMWELLETQLSIMRFWRKYCAMTPMVDGTMQSKDYQLESKILQAAALTLRPFAPELFRGVVRILDKVGTDEARASDSSGASLDGILFLLDAYTHSLSTLSHKMPTNQVGTVGDVDPLISMYVAVMSMSSTSPESTTGAPAIPPPVASFTTYGESIAAQFPSSMRHLVIPDSATTIAVTLDPRSMEEILSRVCVALCKIIDLLYRGDQCDALIRSLSALIPTSKTNDLTVAIGHVISRVLDDVKHVMEDDAFARFRLAGVALVRKLVEVAGRQGYSPLLPSGKANSDRVDDLVGNVAYDLLCDHVIHQPPLLRSLLALSFSTSISRRDVIIERAAVVLAACGFVGDVEHEDQEPSHDTEKVPNGGESIATNEHTTPKATTVRVRRRRLRQISDEDDDKVDAIVETPNVASHDSQTTHHDDSTTRESCQRPPRLTTKASQNAALLGALTLLEAIHTQTFSLLMADVRPEASSASVGTRTENPPRSTGALASRAARIESLLSSSVFATSDASWLSTRALAKVSSVAETAVRIGKQCVALANTNNNYDDTDRDALVKCFEANVAVAVRGRVWFALVRDATTQSTAKSKLSGTILKLDVFLLEVPTLVTLLMKTDTLPTETKRSLRVFLANVESDLAECTSMARSRTPHVAEKKRSSGSTTPTKRHLVGVVPVVHTKRRKRLRSRHAFIDSCLAEEDGDDAFADLEDFIA